MGGGAYSARGRRGGLVCALLGALLLIGAGLLAGCDTGSLFGAAETATPTSTPVPTETPGPSPTPDPTRPDDIVYVRRFIFGLSGDLYLVHIDGLAPRQITAFTRDQASAASDYPVWSPDHKTVAFASEYRDLYNLVVWNLYQLDQEGNGAQQITGLPQPNGGYFPPLDSNIPGVSARAMWTAPPGVRVHGRVLANGTPVAGAVVVSWLGRGFVRTAADGTYVLADVPPSQRGWIKATGEAGAGWVWLSPSATDNTAPDITLDPRLGGAEYTFPAWDLRGGMWSLYDQHWFDPATHDPRYETQLVHMQLNGSALRDDIYSAQSKTLGRPRANPAHPEQVALADGTDLLLLTIDLAATPPVTARHVIRAGVLRNSPVAWSPDGSKLYYTLVGTLDPAYDSLQELDLASGQAREVTLFRPDQQENSGFDLSPDGKAVVYEENGDLFWRPIAAPPTTKPHHITYYGTGSQPTWGGH
ncbi:MAG TPA: hypothetical protein VKY74_12315 [Chloroflexia bacterium]|nr:hypothetical protein [Chloroflexia bacterium]